MRVLFIDDNELQHFLIKSEIEEQNLDINPSFAFSGEEAIKFLELLTLKGEALPTIIVVDVLMPTATGFDFVNEFEEKFFEKCPDTRIFYLTHRPVYFSVEALKTPSVWGFLQKPFTKQMYTDMQHANEFVDNS